MYRANVDYYWNWEPAALVITREEVNYRRLTLMMLDADIVAMSPTDVWRVLRQAGLLSKWNGKPSKKGTGFEQPWQPFRRAWLTSHGQSYSPHSIVGTE